MCVWRGDGGRAVGKTRGQTLQPFLQAQHSFCVLSAKRNRQRWCFHWKSIHPMCTRSPQHGTQMGQFPAIFHRITLHSSSRSTKLISWREQSPGWLSYTLMPTVKYPVVLTACETCREMRHVLEMLTGVSDMKASEGWCQVKKRMSVPTSDQANHQFPRRKLKTSGRKKKQNRRKPTKFSSSLERNWTVLGWCWLKT